MLGIYSIKCTIASTVLLQHHHVLIQLFKLAGKAIPDQEYRTSFRLSEIQRGG